MTKTTGVVHKNKVTLPDNVNIPDGAMVKVIWDDDGMADLTPYEREELSSKDVHAEIAWATGSRFSS